MIKYVVTQVEDSWKQILILLNSVEKEKRKEEKGDVRAKKIAKAS